MKRVHRRSRAMKAGLAMIPRITAREAEVLFWMAQGKTNAEAAGILGVSAETVKDHLANASLRLRATNKTHAVAIAIRNGLI